MCGNAEMMDLPLRFCLHKRFKCAAWSKHGIELFHARIVYLIEIYVIGTQIFEADADIPFHTLTVACHALGRKVEFITLADQSITDKLLADRITPCGINIIYSLLNQRVYKLIGTLLIHPLDRDASEADP